MTQSIPTREDALAHASDLASVYEKTAAVNETRVLQRIHRNQKVSAQHFLISNVPYELYGRTKLGVS